jgi:hypothetical protein
MKRVVNGVVRESSDEVKSRYLDVILAYDCHICLSCWPNGLLTAWSAYYNISLSPQKGQGEQAFVGIDFWLLAIKSGKEPKRAIIKN